MSASTFGGYEHAILAAVRLDAGLGDAARAPMYRAALIASLERLQQAGCGPWVDEYLEWLRYPCWEPIWAAEGPTLIRTLGELLLVDEAAAEPVPFPCSREITPPPSGAGDDLARETAAAWLTRDTEPPCEAWDPEKTIVPV